MERMERIENLDGRVFRAQGIVSVDAFIRMSIVSFLPAAFHSITPAGSVHETTTFFPKGCCGKSFAASSSMRSSRPSRMASSASREI
jgi:hypothetical protein